jgi:eukaryotic-like serine/threonine-protein kinase
MHIAWREVVENSSRQDRVMPTGNRSADRDPLDRLAEEFVTRYRNGERPALAEYVDAYPDLAEQIEELFPSLLMMEQIKPAEDNLPPNPQHSLPDSIGRLGDFRILRTLGRGGMGVVYEAIQESLGRQVALKVLPSYGRLDATQLGRFRREARAAAGLHHTNIVPVFAVGEQDGVPYYAMQFIRGQGIDTILDELRRLRHDGNAIALHSTENSGLISQPGETYFRTIARIGAQTADALAYAHAQGICHRDIKPSNLLLDACGTVWIADFGLAKAENGEGDGLTHTGDVVGTLRYMAPERFNGLADARSDVYALGATLYEMLTLRPAFVEPDRLKLIDRISSGTIPKPRSIDPSIPSDLETIVTKAIACEAGERYISAQAFADDLNRFLANRTILARRSSPRERAWRWCRRNPAVASLTTLVATLTISVAILSTWAAYLSGRLASELAIHNADARTGLSQTEVRLRTQ